MLNECAVAWLQNARDYLAQGPRDFHGQEISMVGSPSLCVLCGRLLLVSAPEMQSDPNSYSQNGRELLLTVQTAALDACHWLSEVSASATQFSLRSNDCRLAV